MIDLGSASQTLLTIVNVSNTNNLAFPPPVKTNINGMCMFHQKESLHLCATNYSEQFNIIALTKIGLNYLVMGHEIIPCGYPIFRREGGVLIAYKSDPVIIGKSDLEVNL